MPLWVQHVLIAAIVLVCAALICWQLVQTLFGRKSKLGSCCAKGCEPAAAKPDTTKTATHFIPIETLERRSQI